MCGKSRERDRARQDSDGQHSAALHCLASWEHYDQISACNNKRGDHAVRDVKHIAALQALLGQRYINEVRYRGGELHRRMTEFQKLVAGQRLANVWVILTHEADKLVFKQLLLIQMTPRDLVAL